MRVLKYFCHQKVHHVTVVCMRATGRQEKYVFRRFIKIFFSLCFERQRCSVLVCWCVCLVSDAARDGKIKYRGRTRHGGKQHIWHPPPASLLLCRHRRRHPSPSIRPEHKNMTRVASCYLRCAGAGTSAAPRRGANILWKPWMELFRVFMALTGTG